MIARMRARVKSSGMGRASAKPRGARKGQSANTGLTTRHGATYFNLLAPGQENEAFFNGSTGQNPFEGVLPESGDYRRRVGGHRPRLAGGAARASAPAAPAAQAWESITAAFTIVRNSRRIG